MFRFTVVFSFVVLYLASAESAAQEAFRFIDFKGKIGKWGEPTLGTPATLSYHYLEKEYSFKGLGKKNCSHMVPLQNALKLSGVSRATFEREAEKAFKGWSRITNLTFIQTDSVEEADVVVGVQADPDRIALTNVAYELLEDADVVTITKAAVCLNPNHEWHVISPNTKKMASIRRMLEHEIGHVIGLEDIDTEEISTVMSYRHLGDIPFTELDFRKAQYLYGIP